MKKQLLILALAVSPVAYADTIYGLYADANYWHASSDSTYTLGNTSTTLDHKDKGQLTVNASLEHGVPLVPNVRVRYADLNTDVKNTNAKIAANSTDLIAYYEILDNVVSVDVGLGAKRLSGTTKTGGQDVLKLDQTLPMAYAGVGAKLPFTGLSAKAELGLAKNHKTSATDALAEIKYNFVDKALVDVGVKAGYRVIDTKYDKARFVAGDAQMPFETNFKGPYVGLEIHF